jgi:hypothetical protein
MTRTKHIGPGEGYFNTKYVRTDQTSGQTIGDTTNRLTKLWATDITVTNAITGSITGNAATATALQNARTIGGTSFDGTANIAIGALNSTNVGATTSLEFKGVISDETGSGALVFATSPTLVTPILGTPTSGTLTNCTGLPISTGVSGLGANVSTFLATPSSANLATAVTDETGSGALVFATSPTLVTPLLGTPTSGTLTNCTGLPISTGVSGLGANVATFLATPSSANLATAITDETGSGSLVFATSPTLVTPLLGTPTSGTLTNCTGLPISTGVSGLGANVATFLATPSSANLATAVTDETGSGVLVFGTSPTFTTQITVPKIVATSDALDIQPTTDATTAIQLNDKDGNAILNVDTTNDRVGIGTTAPGAKLTISANSSALPAPATGTILHCGQADATVSRFLVDAYGSTTAFTFRHCAGTVASPTQTLVNTALMNLNAIGHDGTNYTSARAYLRFLSAENFTSTATGTKMDIQLTAIGATSATTVVTILGNGNFGIGTTPDYPLHIIKTYVADTVVPFGMFLGLTTSVTTTGAYYTVGGSFDVSAYYVATTKSSTGYMRAMSFVAYINSSSHQGTLATNQGVFGQAGIYDCGTGGTITNSYGGFFSILNSDAAGTITNGYGIYIDNSDTTGTMTNRYGVYQVGTTAQNYFQGNIYTVGNCSALSFTDRTPFYDGDALKEIKAIKGTTKGEIDHATLPSFARKTKTITYRKSSTRDVEKGTEEVEYETKTEEVRDLGAMVSILTKAVQQLTKRIEKLEAR